MVPANSCRIPRVPHYSGVKIKVISFHVRDYHALWLAFPDYFASLNFRCVRSHDPGRTCSTGLGCSRFARRYYRNHYCFLFLEVLRWFTSLGLLSFELLGSPIRKSAGQRLSASHRSLSQLTTSFIASKCQGIHRMPLVA